MSTRVPYAVQTVQRSPIASGFDATVALVMLFLLMLALLPIW